MNTKLEFEPDCSICNGTSTTSGQPCVCTLGSQVHPSMARPAIAPVASTTSVGDAAFPDRDESRPTEQQGMFRKFEVRRVDGSDQPGGKHHGCRYFVLDLNHDQHAPAALRAYAAACRATHPQLANDIEREFGSATAAAPDSAQQGEAVNYSYASTQSTRCAGCGELKHTPLRIDAMGGYVCLTCIDKKLGSLLDEFGYPPAQQGEDEPPLPEPLAEVRGKFRGEWDYVEAGDNYCTFEQTRQYGDARAAHAVAHMMRKLGDGVGIEPVAQHIEGMGVEFFHGQRKYAEASRKAVANAVRAAFSAKLAQARAAGAERAVPEGLLDRVKAAEKRVKDGHAPRRIPADPTDVDLVLAEVRLLLEGRHEKSWWIAAAPSQAAAKEGWKPLADDKPDVTRKIDVVLMNGVTLENGDYRKIDWTQVRDWRYSPTQQDTAQVDAEGGEA